jgi:rhodanese-related sulfurtransferase
MNTTLRIDTACGEETNNIRMTKCLLIQLARQFDFFRFAIHWFSFVLAHVGRCERSRSSSPEERPQVNHQDTFLRFAKQARSRIAEITPMELAKKRLRPVMIDLREEEEFLSGHICGAKHISRGSLEERIGHVVSDLTTPILVYCPRGDRGALTADSLQKMGYRNVYSLKGGLQHWLEAGGTLECPASRRRASAQISHTARIKRLVAGSVGEPELTPGAKALNESVAFTS